METQGVLRFSAAYILGYELKGSVKRGHVSTCFMTMHRLKNQRCGHQWRSSKAPWLRHRNTLQQHHTAGLFEGTMKGKRGDMRRHPFFTSMPHALPGPQRSVKQWPLWLLLWV